MMSRLLRYLYFGVLVSLAATLADAAKSPSAFVGHRPATRQPRQTVFPQQQRLPQHASVLPTFTQQILPGKSSSALAYAVSPEPIHTAFSVATFGPQIFWLLMIVLPKANITKKVMGGFETVLLFCLVHFFIVSGSISGTEATAPLAEFNEVFNPAGDPQNAFIGMVSNYPNFVAEEWSHVLTWDLLVGRYIWLDGLKRGIFTSHSVLLSNLIGPPGLLLHWATCLVSGKEPWEKDAALEEEER